MSWASQRQVAEVHYLGDTLHERLINWGRWRWRDLMVGRPDGSCANPMYEFMRTGGDDDGYADQGETGSCVVLALRTLPAKAEPVEVDEYDAENLHGYVAQIEQGHRSALARRYVTLDRGIARPLVEAALRALRGAMDANYEAVREIERRLHGR
jgi:hypothetical protein